MKGNVVTLVSQSISLYDSIPAAKNFFSVSRQRLQDLLYRIGSSQTRIAVIGITSSGKSTLLNSILGLNLLPTGVAPSSGRQVLCGYDKTLHADIIFSPESGKERLVITEDIENKLRKYGDERYNPQNREQVDEIHVYSPNFKFDHELIFVDTPGLDAKDLGVHEEITLKLVLPIVDMILYLTTVKCDSDGQNLNFIDRSTSDIKPLILVQNKIDSIAPKITRRGVEKTVDDIKQEHLNRLQRLLSGAQKESVRKAPIVQVSANAPSWELSNLESLKQVLSEQIKVNSVFRDGLFYRQFVREIEETQGILSSILTESQNKVSLLEKRKKSMSLYMRHILNVKSAYSSLNMQIQSQFSEIQNSVQQVLKAIDNKYEIKTASIFTSSKSSEKKYRNPETLDSGIKSKKEALSKQINAVLTNFSNNIPGIQTAIKVSCADLNLQERQVVRTEFFGTASVSISDCQKVIKGKYHPARRVKQSGFRGGTKRFFGGLFGQDDWGYVEEPAYYDPDTTECDVPKLIQEIKNAFAHFNKFLSEKLPVFQRNTEYSIGCLQEEYSKREQELEAQFHLDIPLDQGNKLLAALQEILSGNRADISTLIPQNAVQKTHEREDQLQEADVESLVFNALKVAENMALECHWSLMQATIQKSGMNEKFICGWDINCLENFRDIFFRKQEEIKIIDFSAPSCKLPNAESLIFLLVNAEQSGSTAKKIFQSGKVSEFILTAAKNGKIVWVMDSVEGLVSVSDLRNDTLIEAYAEMLKIACSVMKNQELFEVMACSRELYYTVLFHELYFNISNSPGEKKRQQFVEEMSAVFNLCNERKHATGQYVNHFINYTKG